MRLQIGLSTQQKQVQILAPRMIQSMEILQLPIMALQERINQELQENPVLDLLESDPDLPEEQQDREDADAPTPDERVLVVDESNDKTDDFDRLVSLSEEWDQHFDGASRPSANRMEEEADRKHDAMANMVSRPQTLQDYLRDQLSWFDLEAPVQAMVERIIYNLDPHGYLQGRLEDLLDPDAKPEDLALAQTALAVVQRLDPPGVGARDLRECLLLQLAPDMEHFEVVKTLITSYLDEVKDNRLPVIQRKTGYTLETIQEGIAQLKMLKPLPGSDFSSTPNPSVTPDVFVDATEDGKYQVRLEDTLTPNLYISPYYRKMLTTGQANDATRDYIKSKINSAQWLIESIEQRRSTLSRVAQAIVDHQTEFLDKGPEYIEPLKMQQIADKVGVHVTTVSRAVDDKWIQTPRGIFRLKRFFGGGTMGANGEEVAWDAVRLKLQEVIDNEDKQNPHSDDELVKVLAKQGLTVARRTVTKYRKAMRIPSSRQRRDWTAAKGKNGHIEHLPDEPEDDDGEDE